MDANLKTKWVEALRSGQFNQTQGSLKRGKDAFCCLGVLCEIVGYSTDASDAGQTYPLLDKLVSNYGPIVVMNDDEGKSFAEIADFIEANL
jgi:hypothetical protein